VTDVEALEPGTGVAKSNPSMDADTIALVATIGRTIRQARRGRLSLEELAAEAQVSAGHISQLENARGNPTVDVLIRIAGALEIDLVDLVQRDRSRRPQIVRRGARRTRRAAHSDHIVELLTPTVLRPLTVSQMTVQPGEIVRTQVSEPHSRCLFVRTGAVEVQIEETNYTLHAGDSLLIRSATSGMRVANPSDVAAELVAVFHARQA
jgi:transcriptional regulator with XRE-family HTH domain